MPKFPLLILALGAFAAFATGCGTDHAKVRYVHASPDAAGLDVAVDGKTVVTNMVFGGVSPAADYLTVAAGNRRVEVRDTGTTNDRINSTVDFASQKTYTLLVSGQISDQSIAAVLKTDDNSAPPAGNCKLRFIHDAPDPVDGNDPVAVDVYVVAPGTDITTLSPTISSLGYQQASSYQTLPAATYEVMVTEAGDASKARLIDRTYDLAAGQIRTLVFVDVVNGGSISGTPLVLPDLN